MRQKSYKHSTSQHGNQDRDGIQNSQYFLSGNGDELTYEICMSSQRCKRRPKSSVIRAQKSERRRIDDKTRCQNDRAESMRRPL